MTEEWDKIKEFISFFIGLLIFTALMLVTYWLVKRKLPNLVGGRFARVISKVYLDRNTYLALVRIFKEYYVLLISPEKAQIIKKLDTIEEGEIEQQEDFKNILHKYVGDKK